MQLKLPPFQESVSCGLVDFCVLHRGGRDGDALVEEAQAAGSAGASRHGRAGLRAVADRREHWLENVKLVKANRDGEIPGVDCKRRVQSEGEAVLKTRSRR